MAPLIILKSLKKEYETAIALRGIDLCVKKGEWISIVGPSGSGKSTLLNLMGGLDYPSTGSIHIDGTDISGLDEERLSIFRRERIGFIFQQSHLIPYLTAVDNVMLAQYFHSIPDRKEADEALKRVGLGERLNHRPSQLSGGEQQRVCIARALINSPEILLADEPTGNLDRENTRLILELLKKLHREEHFTIILITHDPYVAEWAQRVVTIEDGRIIKDELLCT